MIKISFPARNMFKGLFLTRENRFLAKVCMNSENVLAHVPNSGRMKELLVEGAEVWAVKRNSAGRKTAFELMLVKYEGFWVAIDSRLPNKIVKLALQQGYFEQLQGYSEVKQEYTYGSSRFDFYLPGENPCLIEVKSVTLVDKEQARFPDAPTERGRKHLYELIAAKQNGFRSIIIFIIQRHDANLFSPNDATDPEFGRALRLALENGVEAYAYKCSIEQSGITLLGDLPIVV